MIPCPLCFQYTCILFDLIVKGQGSNDLNFVCEILSCSYTYIYQIIIKVTSFLLATLCHVFIHLHTKYEGTGLKTKIFCCRQN